MKLFIFVLFISAVGFADPRELFYAIRPNGNALEIDLSYDSSINAGLLLPKSAKIETKETKEGKTFVKYKVKGIRNWCFGEKEINWIEKDFFQVHGRSLFVIPNFSMYTPLKVHIDWDEGLNIANSFGVLENHQSFETIVDNFKLGIYLGGKDLFFEKISVLGEDIYVLFNPKLPNRDKILEKIQTVVEQQRTFYNQNNFPNYLVSILKDRKTGGATAFYNACCIYLAKSSKEEEQFNWYFPHEHFHNFHGIRVNTGGTSEDFSWFIEGFTEYYTNLTNLRIGHWEVDGFIKKINQTIKEHDRILSKKGQTASRRLPYVKGHLLALHLDNLIFNESSGRQRLDDFMKDVYQTFYLDKTQLSFEALDSLFFVYYTETSFSALVNEFLKSKNIILDHETWFEHRGLTGALPQYKV